MHCTFLEWEGFADKLYALATEDEYTGLQAELASNPEKGDLIKGLHGARKVRMDLANRGKRGGARVIYYLRHRDEIWMLDIYSRSEAIELDWTARKWLAKVIDTIKEGV